MLKAEPMVKLRIMCQNTKLKSVIGELHKAKALDIIEHKKDEALDIGSPLKGTEELSEIVIKIRSILYQFGLKPDKKVSPTKIEYIKTKIRQINNLHGEVSDITKSLKETNAVIKSLSDKLEKQHIIKKIGIDTELYKETEHIKYYLGAIDDIKSLKNDLKTLQSVSHELSYTFVDGKTMIALFFDKSKENDILEVLRAHSFVEFGLSEDVLAAKLPELSKRLSSEHKKKKVLDKKLAQLKKQHETDVLATERALSIFVEKSEAPLMFGQTANISIISCWVPEQNKTNLVRILNKITKQNINIEELEIKREEGVPVKLNNPNAVKPYEFLLRLFSMPSYGEIDPSIFMFITFPLFFGFMLGDIGYGIVTLIFFLILKQKMPDAKALLNIMIFCSISSILFGVAFGEVFGFELTELGAGHGKIATDMEHSNTIVDHGTEHVKEHSAYPLLHRNSDKENVDKLIIISLIIEFLHVNFGLLLGFINVFQQHGFLHALYEKASWFILQIGVAFIVLSAMDIFPQQMLWVGFGIIVLVGFMLFKGEGIQGLIELPSIFVHIGSYLRLMAIGLASVALAVVINEQTRALFSQGIVGIIGGIIIFTIGHIINITLGIIGPFLHSLRLHYVEHFTKFYKGGGKEFSPFGANGG